MTGPVSSEEASWYRREDWGEGNRKWGVDDGKGKERRKASLPLFPLPIVPRTLCIFPLLLFCWDTHREPLRRREWQGSAFCIVLAWVKKVTFIRMMQLFVPFPRRLCRTRLLAQFTYKSMSWIFVQFVFIVWQGLETWKHFADQKRRHQNKWFWVVRYHRSS